MPLIMVNTGESGIITRIEGKKEVRQHLENLGFVVGALVEVISKNAGGLIVQVKDCRVALSSELACKIML